MTQVFAEPAAAIRPADDGFQRIIGFGTNPGHLRLWAFVPDALPPGAPLVVVLHGCGQGGPAYAAGAGWVALAGRLGFAVLAPEQKRLNNPKGCFNWFSPADMQGERGEAASIRQMVLWMLTHYQLDRRRVFITGLSAGAAMAAALVTTYPGLFAGAALVAGVPFGAAANVRDALHAMFEGCHRTAADWAARAQEAAAAGGGVPATPSGWPRVSLWHGTADAVVVPANADESIKQWTALHGVADSAPAIVRLGADTRRRWSDSRGRVVVEDHRLAGLGHGTPVDSRLRDEGGGEPGPFLIDAGVASSVQIAAFWGLDGAQEQPVALRPLRLPPSAAAARAPARAPAAPVPLKPAARAATPVPAVPGPAMTDLKTAGPGAGTTAAGVAVAGPAERAAPETRVPETTVPETTVPKTTVPETGDRPDVMAASGSPAAPVAAPAPSDAVSAAAGASPLPARPPEHAGAPPPPAKILPAETAAPSVAGPAAKGLRALLGRLGRGRRPDMGPDPAPGFARTAAARLVRFARRLLRRA